jgi:hypothetical protein
MKIDYSEKEDIYYSDLKLNSLESFGKIREPKALIRIDFHTLFEKPTIEQKNAFNYLIENEKDVFDKMILGIIDSYNKEILSKFKDYAEFLPVIKTPMDLKREISIDDIIVSNKYINGTSYVMYKGDCSWDDEHGFCVVMNKNQFIEFGSWDLHY